MSRRVACTRSALTLAAALAALPAAAEEEGWTFRWDNGFKLDSADGRFRLRFGGRLQADYSFLDADPALEAAFGAEEFEDGFEFRRARFAFEGEIYERVGFKIEYDFATGEAEPKDVYIALLDDRGTVAFGHFKEPFSLETLTSDLFVAFVERSLPIEAFSPDRNAGLGASGAVGDRFNWGVGAFYETDHLGHTADEDATNLTARVAFRPLFAQEGTQLVHVGLGASRKKAEILRFRTRPESHLTTRLVDTGDFTAEDALLADLELATIVHRFWAAGEYVQAAVDAPASGDPTFDGAYVQAGIFLTPDRRGFRTSSGGFDRVKPSRPWLEEGGIGAWELVARWSTVDLTDELIAGGEQDDVTLGLNWYPNASTRLMLDYVLADVDGVGELDSIVLRWQVDF